MTIKHTHTSTHMDTHLQSLTRDFISLCILRKYEVMLHSEITSLHVIYTFYILYILYITKLFVFYKSVLFILTKF